MEQEVDALPWERVSPQVLVRGGEKPKGVLMASNSLLTFWQDRGPNAPLGLWVEHGPNISRILRGQMSSIPQPASALRTSKSGETASPGT